MPASPGDQLLLLLAPPCLPTATDGESISDDLLTLCAACLRVAVGAQRKRKASRLITANVSFRLTNFYHSVA